MTLEPLEGLKVVDLYAGSGALGIEALSRGAAHADFVESARAARAALQANLETLGLRDRATLWPLALPRALDRMKAVIGKADVILVDPPYGGEEARALLAALADMPLKSSVRVVLEHHTRDPVSDQWGALERSRERQYGETRISTYTLRGAQGSPAPLEEDAR